MAYPSFGAGELIFRDPDLASLITHGNLESAFQEDRADQCTQENFIKAGKLEELATSEAGWISFFKLL